MKEYNFRSDITVVLDKLGDDMKIHEHDYLSTINSMKTHTMYTPKIILYLYREHISVIAVVFLEQWIITLLDDSIYILLSYLQF